MLFTTKLSKVLRVRESTLAIICLFLFWRVSLIFFSIISSLIPLYSKDFFLGGGYRNYLLAPQIFGWSNFDGEHYISLAMFGYRALEYAFFPIYPKLIAFFNSFFNLDYFSLLISSNLVGLLISNLCFLLALIILYDLLIIDFSKKISALTLVILVFFPTSFYFGSVYTESLFLLLSLLSFYMARKKRWFLAGIFGGIASATRVFGIVLFPALLIQAFQDREKINNYFWILLIPLGLLGYMYYLNTEVGDPLAFYHLQKIVGEQHQSGVVLIPQVYFRYLKMLIAPSLTIFTYQTLILEIIVGVMFFILPIYGFFKKMKYSYLFFAFMSFIIPTFQGSFSSSPRYVLVIFPSFLILAILMDVLKFRYQVVSVVILYILLGIETVLFLRGYWVA